MIVTTDLHLTSKPLDQYRWDFFPWLAEFVFEVDAPEVWILGDLMDQKDGHDAQLTNRVVDTLCGFVEYTGCQLRILKGNHDYVDETTPFFRFLNHFDAIHYISEPEVVRTNVGRTLFVPHSFTPESAWRDLDFSNLDLIACHQTFNGADAHGHKLRATISAGHFKDLGADCPVISGDIHQPQTLKTVRYVGTPYPVGFGEDHEPRVLEIVPESPLKFISHPVPSIKREIRTVSDVEDAFDGLDEEDHLKVRFRLAREEFVDWNARRQEIIDRAEELGVVLHSIDLLKAEGDGRSRRSAGSTQQRTPDELIRAFSKNRNLFDGQVFAAEDVVRAIERHRQ